MVRVSLLASLLVTATLGSATEHVRERPRKARSNVVPGAYIIEFEDGHSNDAFRVQSEPEYEVFLDLTSELFRGASIQLNDVENAEEKVARLASLSAVKSITPVGIVELPETVEKPLENIAKRTTDRPYKRHQKRQEPLDRARSAHVMTQVDKVHAEGITGSGIKIAVVDSGIDYTHPALGGCFGEGCLVTYGWDFVGDDFDGANDANFGPDPKDCGGHGTHVAGIIAAQENELGILGAAPDVTLSAYRVFGCSGYTRTDIIMAAFTRAYEEGADIITASLGSISGWSGSPAAVLASRIVERGVPFTVSVGNSGVNGMWEISSPATGKGVTAIGSFDNIATPMMMPHGTVTMDGNRTRTTFPFQIGYPFSYELDNRPVWATSFDTNSTNDACSPLPDDTPDLSGYQVLVRRATDCDMHEQFVNLGDKGAVSLIIYNNRAGLLFLGENNPGSVESVVSIEEDEGITWVQALEAGLRVHVDGLSYSSPEALYINPNPETGGAASEFSSMGPTFEMDLKTQFGAPGGDILSTEPLSTHVGELPYGIRSGTSMSTPFVAASIALLLQARGRLLPAEITEILSSNANPQVHNLALMYESPVWMNWFPSVALQGAGLIQVRDAIHASTLLSPSSLSFNDTANFAGTLNFTLSNMDNSVIAYTISHAPARSIYSITEDGWMSYFPYEHVEPSAELDFSESKVEISPGESVTVAVTATPPQGLNESRYPLWSGYIAVNGSDGTSLSLPYQGLLGSLYDTVQLMPETVHVRDSSTWNSDQVSPNTTFTLPVPGTPLSDVDLDNTATPVLGAVFDWGSPQFIADVVPLPGCAPNSTLSAFGYRSIGQMIGFPVEWQSKGEWEWPWLGQLHNGEYAPPGRYKIVTRVLRITGDADQKEDWVLTETGTFGIRYSS